MQVSRAVPQAGDPQCGGAVRGNTYGLNEIRGLGELFAEVGHVAVYLVLHGASQVPVGDCGGGNSGLEASGGGRAMAHCVALPATSMWPVHHQAWAWRAASAATTTESSAEADFMRTKSGGGGPKCTHFAGENARLRPVQSPPTGAAQPVLAGSDAHVLNSGPEQLHTGERPTHFPHSPLEQLQRIVLHGRTGHRVARGARCGAQRARRHRPRALRVHGRRRHQRQHAQLVQGRAAAEMVQRRQGLPDLLPSARKLRLQPPPAGLATPRLPRRGSQPLQRLRRALARPTAPRPRCYTGRTYAGLRRGRGRGLGSGCFGGFRYVAVPRPPWGLTPPAAGLCLRLCRLLGGGRGAEGDASSCPGPMPAARGDVRAQLLTQ